MSTYRKMTLTNTSTSTSTSTNIHQNILNFITEFKPVIHIHGRSVAAPNGAGKSYFADRNPKWVDGDKLLLNVVKMKKKLEMTNDDFKEADKITRIAKKKGLWILTSTWWDPELIDAFVVPPEYILKERLLSKDSPFPPSFYEKNVKPYIKDIIFPLAKKHSIPILKSFHEL